MMSAPVTHISAVRYEREQAAAVDERAALEHAPIKIRLTRRGRAVFGALAALLLGVVIAAVAIFAAPGASASGPTSDSAQFGYVVVQPGQTLWSVATALDPQADPRDVIAEIVTLNQLGSSGVQAGQPVAVPLRFSEAPEVISADELGV